MRHTATVAPQVSLGSVRAKFYPNVNDSGVFDITPQAPLTPFAQDFEVIDFDPPTSAQVQCSNSTGINENSRPFTDVVPQPDGTCKLAVAQGNGLQAGSTANCDPNNHATLCAFEAVFNTTLTVESPGQVTFNFYSDDGWIFGLGPQLGQTGSASQPTYVSGSMVNAPAGGKTAFNALQVVGADNQNSSPTQNQVTVNFPVAGTFPMEVDYTECCGGQEALTIGTTYQNPIVPASLTGPTQAETRSPREHHTTCVLLDPVNCDTGDFYHDFTDFSIPGRGVPLQFTRTYNSLNAPQNGPLGYGWTDNYNVFLSTDAAGNITVHEETGSQITFAPNGSYYQAPSRVLAALTKDSDGTFTLTDPDQTTYVFAAPTTSATGPLLRITDHNNYTTTLTYSNGQLSTVMDPAGRQLTFSYNAAGRIASITDPNGRRVSFGYDSSGNLSTATDVANGVTAFTYDASHHLLTLADPNKGVLSNRYDSLGRVISQTDPMSRTSTLAYTANADGSQTTTITDPKGNITTERYENNELVSLTEGTGTAQAATTTYTYDPSTLGITSVTDPNGHVSTYSYDANGNLTSATDPLGRTTSYTYDALNDPTSVTDPLSITTVLRYDSAGNLYNVSRPLLNNGGSVGSAQVSAARPAASGAVAAGSADARTVPQPPSLATGTVKAAQTALGRLPMRFEPNVGQTDSRVAFLARGTGYALFLTPAEAVLTLSRAASPSSMRAAKPLGNVRSASLAAIRAQASRRARQEVLRLSLAGANPHPQLVGLDRLPGVSNYLIGNDPRKWHLHVPGYGRVAYRNVYPGVDLVYHGSPSGLEYDFVVRPGANPRAIQLAVAGAKQAHLDSHGNLLLQISDATLRENRPVIYQEEGGRRQLIGGGYVLRGSQRVGIALHAYNRHLPLVIDPTLVFDTALYGLTSMDTGVDPSNGASAIAVDSAGNSYITGSTDTSDFPVLNPIQGTNHGGGGDAFVSKLNASGALVYSTYLGSSLEDYGTAIAVDSAGDAYIAGTTFGTDFPTYKPLQANDATQDMAEGFVTKLNAGGSGFIYSTYLGDSSYSPSNGAVSDEAEGIAVDSAGDAVVVGYTASGNFPVHAPLQPTKHSASGDDSAFVSKINATGSALLYSTYLGGSGSDAAYAVALDGAGNVYVTGEAGSADFPTKVAWQATSGGGGDDAFVSEINASGSALVYSTYLGGGGVDEGLGIAVDGGGNAYVTGATYSSNFPLQTPFRGVSDGGEAAFASKFAANGSLLYSTYLCDGVGYGIAVDQHGYAYITGQASGNDVPQQDPLQAQAASNQPFVVALTPPGNAVAFGSYLLGQPGASTSILQASGNSIAVDGSNNLYVAGGRLVQQSAQPQQYYAAFADKINAPVLPYAAVSLTYDPNHPGDVVGVTDPNGNTTQLSYDAYGDVSKIVDAAGDTTTISNNILGWPLSVVSPDGNVTGANPSSYTTALQYNNFGDVTRVTDPLGHATSYQYDADGNQTVVTDALNHTTRTAYDFDNEAITLTRADSSILRSSYDADGNRVSQTNGMNQKTTYTFDPLNRLASMTDPLNRTTTYSYDLAGNLTSVTDPMTRTTTLGYDAANELTSIQYSDGVTPNVSYTYTLDGQRLTMQDGTGTSHYSYDSLNRLIQSISGAGQSVGYGYDLAGNVTSLTYPNGSKVTRTYDAADRLTSVQDWLSRTTSFSYDPDGNLTNEQFPFGSLGGGYNPADQLTSLSGLLGFVYSRDNLGQLLSSSFTPGAGLTQQESTHSYGYDALNRLTSDQQPNHLTTWTYNAADALTGIVDTQGSTTTTSTLGYDAADELTSLLVKQGTTTTKNLALTYNADGDRTGQTNSVGNTTDTFSYDQADRLTKYVQGSTGAPFSYAYDGDGLRQSRTALPYNNKPALTARFAYDLAEGLPLTVQAGLINYITGPGGLPVEQIDSAGNTICYEQDQLGSTRALLDSSGNVVGQYTYDAYGNTVAHSGTVVLFQYAGQYTDPESGLQYLRARYYDPATEQFTTADPLGDQGEGIYPYGADNPVNEDDPSGLVCHHWWTCLWDNLTGGGSSTKPQVYLYQCGPYVVQKTITGYRSTYKLISPILGSVTTDKGNRFHYDKLNGGTGEYGPSQLQARYPDTKFRFAPRGAAGPDVEYIGGPHPSTYPNSNWPADWQYADFKPNTASGYTQFLKDINSGKFPDDTVYLGYNPQTLTLEDEYYLP